MTPVPTVSATHGEGHGAGGTPRGGLPLGSTAGRAGGFRHGCGRRTLTSLLRGARCWLGTACFWLR